VKIFPVILSGGSGSRLWPLSRAALPKQLLPLVSDRTMLQETVLRVASWPDIAAPLIVCGDDHRFLVAEQLRQIDITPTAILLEKEGRNTAPAVAAAANYLLKHDADAMMLVLPADHLILDPDAFQRAVMVAADAVGQTALATFGIVPLTPETGYGYIRRGAAVAGTERCFAVEQFVEKPDRATAERFIADQHYSWNSGMFLFRADTYLAELERLQPEMAACSKAAVDDAYADLSFCRLNEAAYAACPAQSIDFAVMEHTTQAIVIPVDIGWSDVGSWSALSEIQDGNGDENVLHGDVYADHVKNSLIRAESRFVAVIGLDDVVVVETRDAVLVVNKDQVQRVKNVVDFLQQKKRSEHLNHTRVYRPWGSYEPIDAGDRFQVKRITVDPGEKLSLQMHHHRAEHWVVVTGTARVTCGETVRLLTENESVYIPIGMTHRLENPGKMPLHLIEVQSGAYLGEDDIVRFDDVYQRA
jgi:mannose-1-phosphate guanylyltransferase/mannose-6-phosphate isomerase